ncbi:MAG: hypothetical protein QNJ18_02820 [Xenococcaceae cyanobacterium MO_167.B52]|nr:hypothetical protein [Xenococcaceae cyanobacterium MO_167.B52]
MASTNQASSKQVGILMENQFEDYLFQIPYQALQKAGAKVKILDEQKLAQLYKSHFGENLKPPLPTTIAAVS